MANDDKTKIQKKDKDEKVLETHDPSEPHVTVEAKPDESVESLLRRFNRAVYRAGIMRRLRELEFYEKPSTRKKQEKKLREKMIRQAQKYNR